METSDYYALGIPLFILVLFVEYGLGRRGGRRLYHPFDTLSNIGCLLGSLVVGIGLGLFTFAAYTWAYEEMALVRFGEDSVVPYLLALFGVDFLYYWWHRCQHRINALWVIHSVHHQSEEYNLAVGLRVPWFSDLTAIFFFWPLPLLGVPPIPFFLVVGILSIYNLFMHTQLLAGTGRYSLLFLTPDIHRVHHSRALYEGDSNYGTWLSVWDRLFGTLRVEEVPIRYGTSRPFASWNPVLAQVDSFRKAWALARAARRPVDRLKIWFKPPGWIPEGAEKCLGASDVSDSPRRFDHRPPGKMARYVVGQHGLVLVGLVLTLVYEGGLSWWQTASIAGMLLLTLAIMGGLSDNRGWARGAEPLRLLLVVLFGAVWAWQIRRIDLALVIAAVALFNAAWFWSSIGGGSRVEVMKSEGT